jgi:DNA-binding NtrC family response regulator
VRHFLAILAAENGIPQKTVTPALLKRLVEHDWPGNVRELYNLLQRAVAFAPDDLRQLGQISGLSGRPFRPGSQDGSFREARARSVAKFERSYVEEALRRSAGNVTQAARLAGKDRRVFGRLIKRHQVSREPW